MSSAKERREKYEESLRRQQEENFNKKDDSGRFKTIYKDGAVPELWKCAEAEHSIDVVSYFAGKNHPSSNEGDLVYVCIVYKHQKIGVNENDYICYNRTYGKFDMCPICTYQAAMKASDEPNEDLIKALNPTRRAIYNIYVRDSEKEKAKGCQIWDVSHYLFERVLLEYSSKKGKKILFASVKPGVGKSIYFKRKGSGATNTEFTAFDFEDRESPIPDSVLDGARCIDELLHLPTKEEMIAALPDNEITRKLFGEREEVVERTSRRGQEQDVPEPELPANSCPSDYEFGTENGYHDECEKCSVYEACAAKFEEYEADKRAEEERREAERKAAEEARLAAEKKAAAAATAAAADIRRRRAPEPEPPARRRRV